MPSQNPVVLFASEVRWDGIWFPTNHLALNVANHLRTLLLEVPVSLLSPLRDASKWNQISHRHRRVSENLAVVSSLGVPPHANPRLRLVNSWLAARTVRSALRRAGWGGPDVIVASLYNHWRLRWFFPDALFVALLTDSFPDFGGAPSADTPAEYRRMRDAAQAAAVVSPPLAQECRRQGLPTLVVPQGVDAGGIARGMGEPEPADLADVAHPRIAFVGTLTDRIDYDTVAEVARARPNWHLVFLGSAWLTRYASREHSLDDFPNVHFLGEKSWADLGHYLGHVDAAWLPYTWTGFNQQSNPMKILEYLAAGLPVVANAFPAVQEHAEFVTCVPEGGDFVASLERAITGESGLPANGPGDEVRSRRQAYAAEHSWARRGEELAAFLVEHFEEHRAALGVMGSGDAARA